MRGGSPSAVPRDSDQLGRQILVVPILNLHRDERQARVHEADAVTTVVMLADRHTQFSFIRLALIRSHHGEVTWLHEPLRVPAAVDLT